MSAIEMLRRMAQATGSPHYGGIDPETVDRLGFSLPGGGMSCYLEVKYLDAHSAVECVVINVHSLGGVVRLRTAINPVSGALVSCDFDTDILAYCYDADRVATGNSTRSRKHWLDEGVYIGYDPRPRDWERLDGWIAVARGESRIIPWHGRPRDADDDPLSVALQCRRNGWQSVYDRELLRHLPNDGPEFLRAAADIVLGRVVVRDDDHKWGMLVDAAIADIAAPTN